jgi:hypothetical protein
VQAGLHLLISTQVKFESPSRNENENPTSHLRQQYTTEQKFLVVPIALCRISVDLWHDHALGVLKKTEKLKTIILENSMTTFLV